MKSELYARRKFSVLINLK